MTANIVVLMFLFERGRDREEKERWRERWGREMGREEREMGGRER